MTRTNAPVSFFFSSDSKSYLVQVYAKLNLLIVFAWSWWTSSNGWLHAVHLFWHDLNFAGLCMSYIIWPRMIIFSWSNCNRYCMFSKFTDYEWLCIVSKWFCWIVLTGSSIGIVLSGLSARPHSVNRCNWHLESVCLLRIVLSWTDWISQWWVSSLLNGYTDRLRSKRSFHVVRAWAHTTWRIAKTAVVFRHDLNLSAVTVNQSISLCGFVVAWTRCTSNSVLVSCVYWILDGILPEFVAVLIVAGSWWVSAQR